MRKKIGKKGLIFTLDAIFAIIAAISIITAATFYLSQVNSIPYNKQSLNKLAQDSLTILEKDGTLRTESALKSNDTLILYLNSLPLQICATLNIHNITSKLLSATKYDCAKKIEVVKPIRTFILNQSTYYASIEAWYK